MSILTNSAHLLRRCYAGLWIVPLPMWLLFFFVGPLLLLFWLSFWEVKNFLLMPDFQFGNWKKMLSASYFWSAYLRTFSYAAMTAVLVSLLAFPMALVITYLLSFRTRLLLLGLIIVPFFTSYLVRIYSWQVYLAENGVIMQLLGFFSLEITSLLNTPLAMLVGFTTLTLPLAIIIQSISVLSLDRQLIDAAYNLGCGPRRILTAVIIPAAKPGLVIGALFVFIFSFGDFVTPTYLGGGKFTTLSILIADTVKSGQQWPRAAVIAVMMIVTLLLGALASISYAYKRR